MSEQLWTIADTRTGEVLAACFITSPAGQHPKDAGWPWDAATQKATKIDTRPDLAVQTWNGSAWADVSALVEAQLIASVKAEAETRKMGFMTAGGAKKAEYSAKRGEVAFWDSLGGTLAAAVTALNLLPPAMKQAKFANAIASAAEFGDATLQPAIERFRGGINRSGRVELINAREEKICAAIRAATTVTAKRAAASGITWPA